MAARVAKRTKADVRDSGVLDGIVNALISKGSARFLWLGKFRVINKTGGKRYSFKTKAMVPYPAYKTVIFTPAEGIHDLLNPGNPRRKRKKR